MVRRRDKGEERRIAIERIQRLGELAAEASTAGREGFPSRYLKIARRIGMRHQVTLPTPLRRRLCRTCGAYLVPGRTERVRLRDGHASQTCLLCGRVERVRLAERATREQPRHRGGAPRTRQGPRKPRAPRERED